MRLNVNNKTGVCDNWVAKWVVAYMNGWLLAEIRTPSCVWHEKGKL